MARYVTTITSPMSQQEAFEFMSDLRNFEDWDPGVQSVTEVEGDGGGSDSVFDVVVDAPGGGLTLRYETIEFESPTAAVVKASSTLFTSLDRIEVEVDGDGSRVTYDAELRLNGPLGIFDLALRPVFGRIGGRADRGLQQALGGVRV